MDGCSTTFIGHHNFELSERLSGDKIYLEEKVSDSPSGYGPNNSLVKITSI